jgi:transcriptional regulator GlxA family with amidase domain
MTPDHPYPVRDRGPGHPARGSEPITLVRHGVVRGHVVTAVGVLRGRLAEPWTASSLAEEVHLSRSQLTRAFDATVGVSPMA